MEYPWNILGIWMGYPWDIYAFGRLGGRREKAEGWE
jgi:hypothetical protein